MRFKDHFSGHAGAYREARPTYPGALFDWLAAEAQDRRLAWDVGCGNGQASRALAGRFEHVVATDPSATQVANAEAHPRIDYRVEPAERSSLADASACLVTVAQALHWFDQDRFHAEVRRVLKPDGVFAAWAYSDCRVAPDIDALKDRVYVDLTGPYWPPERVHVDAGYRDLPFPYEEIAVPAFAMTVRWGIDRYLAYLRSWSASQRYLQANGTDPVAIVDAELRAAWGDGEREARWDFHVRAGRLRARI
jgi:SAM-dependent methyltransferase